MSNSASSKYGATARLLWRAIAAVLACLALPMAALGATPSMVIGVASDLHSTDPHRTTGAGDELVASHVFEGLVRQGRGASPVAALATAWTQSAENTWQFTLRTNVRFHDGAPLTAEDVVLSVRRAIRWKPALVLGGKPEWISVDRIDSHTVQIRTTEVYPYLMQALAGIRIVHAASLDEREGAGRPALLPAGTGPYRLVTQQRGTVVLESNPHHWQSVPAWASITFRSLPDAQQRVGALRANEVDLIERVSVEDAARLRSDARFTVHQAASGRLMYLQLGTHQKNPPFVSFVEPTQSGRNPLLERRVRRAISQAIDRRQLTETILQGMGEPAGQLVPDGFFGHVPALSGDRRDLEDARALLAESGFPGGFALTLHGPENVYPEDAAVLRAIARMLGDAGIRAQAVVETPATFAYRGARQQYSAFLRGFAGVNRDASEYLVSLLASYDAASGAGALNWARYTNGTLDSMIRRIVTQPNAQARELMLQEATRLAINDVALVPLYFAHDAWAARSGLRFLADSDQAPLGERVAERSAPGP